jgi:hypothetical protein
LGYRHPLSRRITAAALGLLAVPATTALTLRPVLLGSSIASLLITIMLAFALSN